MKEIYHKRKLPMYNKINILFYLFYKVIYIPFYHNQLILYYKVADNFDNLAKFKNLKIISKQMAIRSICFVGLIISYSCWSIPFLFDLYVRWIKRIWYEPRSWIHSIKCAHQIDSIFIYNKVIDPLFHILFRLVIILRLHIFNFRTVYFFLYIIDKGLSYSKACF